MYRNRYKKPGKCTAKIDIRLLKDHSMFNHIIDSSVKAEIEIDLSKLKNTPKVFAMVMADNIDKWVESGSLYKALKIYDESVRTPELDKIINSGIVKFANNIVPRKPGTYTRYKLGKDIPNAINSYIGFMSTDTKSKVLSEIIGKQDSFYPYAKKILAQTAVELAGSDKELVEVLNSFYKVMEKNAFFGIVDKITDGIENPGVKKILDKTKKFHVCRYTKYEIDNNNDKRIELLKDIARTPSSAKNINFAVTFNTNDLKKLASVMRFNFLQWYFKDRFRCASRTYRTPTKYKFQLKSYIKDTGLDKVRLETIKDSELNEILFGVGFKKNAQVQMFIDKYKCFKKIESGISLPRNDIVAAFGPGYYW